MINYKCLCFLMCFFVTGLEISSVATAEKTESQLHNVERALNKGQKQKDDLQKRSVSLGNDLKKLKLKTVQVANAIQQHEMDVMESELTLKQLSQTEKNKLSLLDEKKKQMTSILMALQRLARYPPEAMIVAPISPADTIRGSLMLRAAVAAIEDKVLFLRRDLKELLEVRNKATAKSQYLASLKTQLNVERNKLDGLLESKKRLKKETESKVKKVEKKMRVLLKKAENLRDLLSQIEVNRKKLEKNRTNFIEIPKIPKTISTHRKRPYPVVGELIGSYGEALETGLTRKGISIETVTGAQVVVPRDGIVVFAGSFKGYGQLLIIEHYGGYHSLMAGMSRIDSAIGQEVLSGEPAGIMGGSKPSLPVLYVELRRKGQPINPLPWLAARNEKVNG